MKVNTVQVVVEIAAESQKNATSGDRRAMIGSSKITEKDRFYFTSAFLSFPPSRSFPLPLSFLESQNYASYESCM